VRRVDYWLTLVVLGAAIAMSGCVSKRDYDALQQIADNQSQTIRRLKNYNHELQMKFDRVVSDDPLKNEELKKLEAQLAIYKDRTARLEQEMQKRFEAHTFDDIEGITKEKWGIRVANAVLFDSGQHKLKASGKQAIKRVAPTLKDLKIRIEGHTDTDPVKHTKERYPYGNLQLSGMRALAVASFLIKECGLDAKNVSYGGFGEYQPVAPNDTKEGKAKNRRVDIRALELVEQNPKP